MCACSDTWMCQQCEDRANRALERETAEIVARTEADRGSS